MQSHKRFIIVLSIASLISSLLIAGLAYMLVTSDDPFSITSRPLDGMKLCMIAGSAHCLLNLLIFYIYSPNSFESRPQILNIVKCCCLLAFSCVVFHITAICFGAPLINSATETFHFAALLTVLVCLPYCLFFGCSIESYFEVFLSERPHIGLETVVYFTSIGAILGAWLGAIPIPLDWDRPWQEWPISCVIGAVGGYSAGLFISAVQLPRKYRAQCKSKFF